MQPVALEYHDVVDPGCEDASGFPGPDAATYKLDAANFQAHLDAIWRLKLPHVPLLTFDDGGASGIHMIADRLEALGWQGHFFITTDYIGAPGFMNATEIRGLQRRGHVIGSHSASHPVRMSACSLSELAREWQESIRVLGQLLGTPIQSASVPGGYFSRRVAEAAAAAGVRSLFTSEPTVRSYDANGCRVLGRFTLRRNSPASYAAALAAGHVWPRLQQWTLWNGKKVAKSVAGPLYLRVRHRLLR